MYSSHFENLIIIILLISDGESASGIHEVSSSYQHNFSFYSYFSVHPCERLINFYLDRPTLSYEKIHLNQCRISNTCFIDRVLK